MTFFMEHLSREKMKKKTEKKMKGWLRIWFILLCPKLAKYKSRSINVA